MVTCNNCGFIIDPKTLEKDTVVVLCPRCIKVLDKPVRAAQCDESNQPAKAARVILVENGASK